MIELHQPLIDTFYGPDKLLYLMEVIQVKKNTFTSIELFLRRNVINKQFE